MHVSTKIKIEYNIKNTCIKVWEVSSASRAHIGQNAPLVKNPLLLTCAFQWPWSFHIILALYSSEGCTFVYKNNHHFGYSWMFFIVFHLQSEDLIIYITLKGGGAMSLNFGESKVLTYEGIFLFIYGGWVGSYKERKVNILLKNATWCWGQFNSYHQHILWSATCLMKPILF